jgi:Zn finger protein HypA/HybF involved in hydrogenase expression
MPYELEKVKGLFYVKNTDTDKRKSKKPMPKKRAVAYMRALYAAEQRAKEVGEDFTIMKQADGTYRWVLFSSNAYQDRDKEIVSTKALEGDVELTDSQGDFGPLRWWHVGEYVCTDPADYTTYTASPGLDIGDCDFRMLKDKVLIESGAFRNQAVAEALVPIAKELQASIRFAHPRDEPDVDGVFNHTKTFERSLLPKGKASNRFTQLIIQEVDEMATVKEKIESFVALLKDADLVNSILGKADIIQKEADAAGVASKAADKPVMKYCATCDKMVTPDTKDLCPDCKADLSKAPTEKPTAKEVSSNAEAVADTPPAESATTEAKELSFDDIRQALYVALSVKFPYDSNKVSMGVMDVFDDWFIYQNWSTNELFRQLYSIDENGVAVLEGDPIQVTRHTVYLPADRELMLAQPPQMEPIMTGMKELKELLTANVSQKDDTLTSVKESEAAQLKRIQTLEADLTAAKEKLEELEGAQPRSVKALQAARASQSDSNVTDKSMAERKPGPDPEFFKFATGAGQQ